jgi:carbon monoxide dehydrogenase subunit G
MVDLTHPITTDKPLDETWALVLDLDRLVPCVQGGSVGESVDDSTVKAKIKVKMGAMSLTFAGTVTIAEQDSEQREALLRVKSRETGGQGHANADVRFTLEQGGGAVETKAQITGKAASMGEGVIKEVLDALIKDFIATFVATA